MCEDEEYKDVKQYHSNSCQIFCFKERDTTSVGNDFIALFYITRSAEVRFLGVWQNDVASTLKKRDFADDVYNVRLEYEKWPYYRVSKNKGEVVFDNKTTFKLHCQVQTSLGAEVGTHVFIFF